MQEYAYPDQKVFIKTHKGYVMSKKKNRQTGKYRRIIKIILRIIQECAYPDQNVLIKTHKGYVTSNNKKWAKSQKKGKKREIVPKGPFKQACPFKTGDFSTPLHLFGVIPSSIVWHMVASDRVGQHGILWLYAALRGPTRASDTCHEQNDKCVANRQLWYWDYIDN